MVDADRFGDDRAARFAVVCGVGAVDVRLKTLVSGAHVPDRLPALFVAVDHRLNYPARIGRGQREADVVDALAFVLGVDYADEPALHIEQSAAGIAAVDGGVDADDPVSIVGIQFERDLFRVAADYALGHGDTIGVGTAHGIHRFARVHLLVLREPRRDGAAVLYHVAARNFEHGKVVGGGDADDLYVACVHAAVVFGIVRVEIFERDVVAVKIDVHLVTVAVFAFVNHVCVGDDVGVARIPVDIDYHARACKHLGGVRHEDGAAAAGINRHYGDGAEERVVHDRLPGGGFGRLFGDIAEIFLYKVTHGERLFAVCRAFFVDCLVYVVKIEVVALGARGACRPAHARRKRYERCRRTDRRRNACGALCRFFHTINYP